MLRVQYTKGTKDKSKEDQKMIEVLMGDEVAPRKEFITSNALDVANLIFNYKMNLLSTLFRIGENLNLDRKTLINLRWIAIFGQFAAINVVYFYLNLDFPIKTTYIIIFIGLTTNLYTSI